MTRQQLKRYGSKNKSTSWYPGKLLIQALDNQKKTFESLDASRTERDQAWHEFKLGQTRKIRDGSKYIKQIFTRDGWQDASKFKGNPKATKKGLLQNRLQALSVSQAQTAEVAADIADGKGTDKKKALANSIYNIESDDPKGAVPFNVEGSYDPITNKLIPSGTNFSQAPSEEDVKFPTDVESPTEDKAQESLKIDSKLKRAKLFVKRHASGKNSVALQKAKLYIREHEG